MAVMMTCGDELDPLADILKSQYEVLVHRYDVINSIIDLYIYWMCMDVVIHIVTKPRCFKCNVANPNRCCQYQCFQTSTKHYMS